MSIKSVVRVAVDGDGDGDGGGVSRLEEACIASALGVSPFEQLMSEVDGGRPRDPVYQARLNKCAVEVARWTPAQIRSRAGQLGFRTDVPVRDLVRQIATNAVAEAMIEEACR